MSALIGTTGVLCGVVIALSALSCDPRCSDGFVELERCEPEPLDDAATPGDDRPGHLTCTEEMSGQDQTCGPGNGCCGGAGCATDSRGCTSPSWFAVCDGPEDCGVDEQCWLDDRSIHCSAQATPYLYVRCHTDLDCPGTPDNPCVNGYCLGDPESGAVPVAE